MQKFTDATGRDWPVTITVGTVRRVRQLVDVDLLKLDEALLKRLATDPVELANVLYVICEPTCDERGISDEQFGELLGGDVIDQATEAFIEAIIDFFPRARRTVARQVRAKAKTHEERLLKRTTERVEANLETILESKFSALELALETELAQMARPEPRPPATPGTTSGSSPELSAPIRPD